MQRTKLIPQLTTDLIFIELYTEWKEKTGAGVVCKAAYRWLCSIHWIHYIAVVMSLMIICCNVKIKGAMLEALLLKSEFVRNIKVSYHDTDDIYIICIYVASAQIQTARKLLQLKVGKNPNLRQNHQYKEETWQLKWNQKVINRASH